MELHYESDRIYINHPVTGLADAEIFFPEGSDGIHNITHTIVNPAAREGKENAAHLLLRKKMVC